MGLGRLRSPTSRLSGPSQTGQIPAICRTFTGRTHDLPLYSGKHAGSCRDFPAQSKKAVGARGPRLSCRTETPGNLPRVRGVIPFSLNNASSHTNGKHRNGMLSRPRREECRAVKGRWAKSALRLLSGSLLLTAIGVSAGHSHIGDLTSPTNCAICQVVGMELDSKADVPRSPSQSEVREDWVFHPPAIHAPAPAVPDLLPRGPPVFA